MDLMLQKVRLRDSTSLRPASSTTERTDISEHSRSSMGEIQDAVRAHNKARIPRNCPIMQWDAELAGMAAEYAKTLATSDRLQHSGVIGQGENLYSSTAECSYIDAVNAWLAEMEKYGGEEIKVEKLGGFGHFSKSMGWTSYVVLC